MLIQGRSGLLSASTGRARNGSVRLAASLRSVRDRGRKMHDVVRTVAHRNVGSETCPYNSITLTDGLKSPYTVIFGPFAVQGVHRRFLARSFRIHEPTTLDVTYIYEL